MQFSFKSTRIKRSSGYNLISMPHMVLSKYNDSQQNSATYSNGDSATKRQLGEETLSSTWLKDRTREGSNGESASE